MNYTLKDLKNAQEVLRKVNKHWESYSGNNPNKYQSEIKRARREFRRIEECLKDKGILERTEKEQLEIELDKLFPNVQSKEIVEYKGRKYQRRSHLRSTRFGSEQVKNGNKQCVAE